MGSKSLTIFLLIALVLAVLWARGGLQAGISKLTSVWANPNTPRAQWLASLQGAANGY